MANVAKPAPPPSITIAPSIQASLVSQIDLLDKSKNNWAKWKRIVIQCLGMVGLDDYLTGGIVCPDAATEPRAAANWRANDKVVCAFLGLKACEEGQEFIEGKTSTKDMWDSLKARHEQEGPITQILLIQEALNVRYSRSERLSTVSTKLADLNTRIFAIGIPTKDVFLSILMLNSLSGELTNVRDHVATSISSSVQFTSNDIQKRLDTEQQIIDSDAAKSPRVNVLVAHDRGKRNNGSQKILCTCMNCKNAGRRFVRHTDATCYHPGGAMEGKRNIVEAERAKQSKTTPSSSKPGTRVDSSGRTFILDKNTNEAFYLATPQAQTSPSSEFIGLTTDTMSPGFVNSLSPTR